MKKPTLRSIQHVFLKAMAAGYAQGVKGTAVTEMPGSNAIPFVFNNFRVLDCYIVTPHSDKSTGVTTIWHDNQPVWVMHYGGWYNPTAIPFLKECLHQAYVKEQSFYGGRGPVFVRGEHLTYVNLIEDDNFAHFSGEENIYANNNQRLGYHWYRGMSLL